MKDQYNKLTNDKALSAREYFEILRLAIYHIDRQWCSTSVDVAGYEISDKIYRQAIKILKALY